MTQIEQQIESLEIQIRVLSKAIAKAKNGRRKAADVARLARLRSELNSLALEQLIAESAPHWEGVNPDEFMDMVRGREPQNENDANTGTVETIAGGEGEV